MAAANQFKFLKSLTKDTYADKDKKDKKSCDKEKCDCGCKGKK